MKVTFPSEFSPDWAASVAGKEVTIVIPLFVTQTYSGSKPQGTIVVSSKVKRAFADVNLPSVVEYSKWVEKQEVDKLLITSEFPLIDPCNTLRIGSEMAVVKVNVLIVLPCIILH